MFLSYNQLFFSIHTSLLSFFITFSLLNLINDKSFSGSLDDLINSSKDHLY
ncbi:hypothetical protein Lalb_Chr21g0305441 [Lupinus albus]|uniref:Uncharacterized protein n=1 Tax=Lupinus albus TaxID=3870 RepID=A0A6A4NR79_LUPAL|nr:hypothetical protein Lalb_Chr21g0305441 [Lupinus albus]